MNNNQQIFINAYLSNGYNATEAYRTAYPNCKKGHQQAGSRLLSNVVIKNAIGKAKKDLEEWLSGSRKLVDRLFSERYAACIAKKDNTNAIRCIENKAKNVGYYALDNAQRTEQAKLSEQQVQEAKEYAKWRLLKGLSGDEDKKEAS